MQSGISKARREILCSVAFAPNVIAVLANHYFVVGDATKSRRGSMPESAIDSEWNQSPPAANPKRYQPRRSCPLRSASEASLEFARTRIFVVKSRSESRIADSATSAAANDQALHPGERRIPCDLDCVAQVCFDLRVVCGVEG